MWLRLALNLAIVILFSACSPSDKAAVDKLNSRSYACHYRDIDSTAYYAQQAYLLSEDYADGKAEAIEFVARSGDPYIGIPLKNLTKRNGTLVAVIVHQGKVIVPFGNDRIEAGDHVVIISRESGIGDLNEVIYR
jgi:Trk K+ transport system NAD-binding subunit